MVNFAPQQVRLSKKLKKCENYNMFKHRETYCSLRKYWMEAYCDQVQYTNPSELYRFLDKGCVVRPGKFNKGLGLGNQNHSTGKLMQSPTPNDIYQAEWTSWAKENSHKQ
eukprot:9903409-Heterocapsa_arctica.AAC.1